MRRSLLLAAVLVTAAPMVVLAQAPFSDWPSAEPERRKSAPAKQPAKKPAPAKADPTKDAVPKADPAKQAAPAAKEAPSKAVPQAKEKPKLEAPMKVVRVRGSRPECEPNCPEWISAEGRIVPTTGGEFKRALAKLGDRKLPILLSSLGGDVKQAEEIAWLIRGKRLDVVVAKTEILPCAPADKVCRELRTKGIVQGRPIDDLTPCASACPIILSGGVRRFVGPKSFLGVHQIQTYQQRVRVTQTYRVETRTSWGVPVSTKKTLVSEKREPLRPVKKETSPMAYLGLHIVFRMMGVDADRLVALYESTPHEKVRWLTRAELLTTRIATHIIGTERVLAGDIPAKPELPAIPRVEPRSIIWDPSCPPGTPAGTICGNLSSPPPTGGGTPGAIDGTVMSRPPEQSNQAAPAQ